MSKNTIITVSIVVAVLAGLYLLLSQEPQSPAQNDLNLSQNLSSNNQMTTTPSSPTAALSPAVTTAPSLTITPTSPVLVTPTIMANGLKIEDLKVGTGPEVKSGDTVTMNYVGTLENGTKFDSSYDRNRPFTTQIGVGQVIQGWDLGIPGMKVGGKRRLTIPAALAYGDQGAGGVIPPGANLIFEVELVSINK